MHWRVGWPGSALLRAASGRMESRRRARVFFGSMVVFAAWIGGAATTNRRVGTGPGTITVRPNPAPAGGEVEVEFAGNPPLYVRTFGGGDWVLVDLGKDKKGRVRVPAGAGLLLFTNDAEPPLPFEVEIANPGQSIR